MMFNRTEPCDLDAGKSSAPARAALVAPVTRAEALADPIAAVLVLTLKLVPRMKSG